MNTWREEIVPWKTLALTWLQTFLRWVQQIRSGDLTWPDRHFFLKCAQWSQEKSPSVSWISRGVWQWHNKSLKWPKGGPKRPPARNRVKLIYQFCSFGCKKHQSKTVMVQQAPVSSKIFESLKGRSFPSTRNVSAEIVSFRQPLRSSFYWKKKNILFGSEWICSDAGALYGAGYTMRLHACDSYRPRTRSDATLVEWRLDGHCRSCC